MRPDTAIFEEAGVACERGAMIVDSHGRTSVPGIWAVGDATLSVDPVTGARRPVALAGPANRAGRLVADDIIRPGTAREIPQPVGTAIVRVGSLTAALTGANRMALDAAGIGYRTLHLHANQHAGYFPGASQIHLVVHVDPDSGRLLGAQAVGTEGVDKRIDVLATAIRAGMAVDELIDLDLAYSPPYGQAKDAVNLTGMVGENVLNGTLKLWYAEDLDEVLDTALVLDVRRDDEWVTGHLPGALHIPHTELRERIDEVREQAAGRPVRVMCASGVRSAIAHRVLSPSRHGLRVAFRRHPRLCAPRSARGRSTSSTSKERCKVPDAQKLISNRLRRARGQLDAVIAAVDANEPCRDVVTQLAAVSSALNRAGLRHRLDGDEGMHRDARRRTRRQRPDHRRAREALPHARLSNPQEETAHVLRRDMQEVWKNNVVRVRTARRPGHARGPQIPALRRARARAVQRILRPAVRSVIRR